ALEPDALRVVLELPASSAPAHVAFLRDRLTHLGGTVGFAPGARFETKGFELIDRFELRGHGAASFIWSKAARGPFDKTPGKRRDFCRSTYLRPASLRPVAANCFAMPPYVSARGSAALPCRPRA